MFYTEKNNDELRVVLTRQEHGSHRSSKGQSGWGMVESASDRYSDWMHRDALPEKRDQALAKDAVSKKVR